jgi:hypothetical protein
MSMHGAYMQDACEWISEVVYSGGCSLQGLLSVQVLELELGNVRRHKVAHCGRELGPREKVLSRCRGTAETKFQKRIGYL